MAKVKHVNSKGDPCAGCGCPETPNGWGCCALGYMPHGTEAVCCAGARHESDAESPFPNLTTDCHAHFPRPSEVIEVVEDVLEIKDDEPTVFDIRKVNAFGFKRLAGVGSALSQFEDPILLPDVKCVGGGAAILKDGRLFRAKVIAYPYETRADGEHHHKTPTPAERAAIETAIRSAIG